MSAGILGALLIYLAWALYPGEKREMKNRLEEWWYRITLAGETTAARHRRFFRETASVVERLLERLSGTIATSILHVGYLSAAVVALMLFAVQPYWSNLLLAFALMVASFAPVARLRSPKALVAVRTVSLSLLPIAFWKLTGGKGDVTVWLDTVVLIAFGACAYYLNLRLIEHILTLVTRPVTARVAGEAAATMVLAGTVLSFPFFGLSQVIGLLVNLEQSRPALSRFVTLLWFSTLPLIGLSIAACWPLVLFAFVVAGVVIHRSFWALSERGIYVLWEHGLLTNRPVLTTLGLSLLGVIGWEWVVRVTETLSALK